jgi:sugar fermentation stimulation protein A
VKSVTLCRSPALAEFPDSVTARGTKHMNDLAGVAAEGHRAVLIYLVQRTDCTHVDIAADIDPKYAAAHAAATKAGVETLCIGTHITPQGISIAAPLALGRPTR